MNQKDTECLGKSFCNEESLFYFIKLGKDTFRYIPAIIIPAFINLLSIAILTRIFTSFEYGLYALVMGAVTILTALLSSWIQQSVLRYLPVYQKNENIHEFMGNLYVIISSLSLSLILVSLLLFPFIRQRLGAVSGFYYVIVLLIIVRVIFNSLNVCFRAVLKPDLYAKFQILSSLGCLVSSLLLILLISKSLKLWLIGMCVGYLLVFPALLRELGFTEGKPLLKHFSFSFLKKLAAYGIPMIGWFIGAQLLGISDRFIIGAFKGPAQVGIYSSNYSLISSGIGLISTPFVMAAHPLIINAWEKGNREKIKDIISLFSRYFLIIAMPIAFYISLFSKEIVTLFLGEEFRVGYKIVPIIIVGFLAWNFSLFGHKGLEIKEKTNIMFLLVAICAIVNIALNFIFVPLYGYIAAAFTTLVSYLLYPIMVYRLSKSFLEWKIPWKSLGNSLVASVVIAIFIVVLKEFLVDKVNLVVLIGFSLLVTFPLYFLILCMLGEMKSFELELLKKLWGVVSPLGRK